jgi:hypothetical protein
MKQLKSDEARRGFRDLLDEVERDPEAAIEILRYDRPVAVMVSPAWFQQATAALEPQDEPGDQAAHVAITAMVDRHRAGTKPRGKHEENP